MKLKYKFVARTVNGKTVAVAVGKDNERFNGMVNLNLSGEFIFKMLREGNLTQDEILSRFAANYGITEETARPAVHGFLDYLRKNDLLEE